MPADPLDALDRLGGGETDDGRVDGIGNPIGSFAPMLRDALASRD